MLPIPGSLSRDRRVVGKGPGAVEGRGELGMSHDPSGVPEERPGRRVGPIPGARRSELGDVERPLDGPGVHMGRLGQGATEGDPCIRVIGEEDADDRPAHRGTVPGGVDAALRTAARRAGTRGGREKPAPGRLRKGE